MDAKWHTATLSGDIYSIISFSKLNPFKLIALPMEIIFSGDIAPGDDAIGCFI